MRFLSLFITVAATSIGCSTAIVVQDSENATATAASSSGTDDTDPSSATASGSSSSDTSGESQTGPSTGSVSSTDPTEATGTTGMAGTDGTSTGTDSDGTSTDAGTSTGTDSGTDSDSSTSTGTDSDGTDSDSDGSTGTGGDECVGLDSKTCEATDGCMALFAKEVDLKGLCTISPATYQGCVTADVCGDAITYACPDDVDPKTPYEFIDTCIPADFTMCEVPDLKGDC